MLDHFRRVGRMKVSGQPITVGDGATLAQVSWLGFVVRLSQRAKYASFPSRIY
jgi:hypothetical protein